MYANPNVIGRAKTKDCRMTPGHSSPPLSRPPIFLPLLAFFLDLYVRMPFQGKMLKHIRAHHFLKVRFMALQSARTWPFRIIPRSRYDHVKTRLYKVRSTQAVKESLFLVNCIDSSYERFNAFGAHAVENEPPASQM